jgi:hypothetical protein
MRKFCQVKALVFACLVSVASPACAQSLTAPLSGVGFLVGTWSSGSGVVSDTGGTSKGDSAITAEAGGAALLRRDHTDLFDAKGRRTGGFDQIMLIYPEAGTLHADYSDGQHVIHYTSATVTPGKTVVFTSAIGAGPTFRLSYDLQSPDTLAVSFAMQPPGQAAFKPVAAGTLKKAS